MADPSEIVDPPLVLQALPPELGRWLQTVLSKGAGGRVVALMQAVDDWMQVCHQQESTLETLEAAHAEAVSLLTDAAMALPPGEPCGSWQLRADINVWLSQFGSRVASSGGGG